MSKLRVLVACEYSGIVRDAFTKRGHFAMSCDLLSSDTEGHHYQGSVLDVLTDGWDIMIAHPPCTYLTNTANRWLTEDSSKSTAQERLILRDEAIEFFLTLWNAPIDKIAIENPQPNPYVIEKVGRFHDKVQPWHFDDPETKGICLWLKNLPPLMSTRIESVREDLKYKLPPSPDRAKLRSRFFEGVAGAMANQWG